MLFPEGTGLIIEVTGITKGGSTHGEREAINPVPVNGLTGRAHTVTGAGGDPGGCSAGVANEGLFHTLGDTTFLTSCGAAALQT